MIGNISAAQLLNTDQLELLIDVRSPVEYKKGHIPGAINVPLFSDEERAHVGTIYKQQSPQKAFDQGMVYVRPKLDWFIDRMRALASTQEPISIHCWRGGQRSRAFAQHLETHGFEDIHVLKGGYKAYRKYILEQLSIPFSLIVLGGFTGSGKTHILHSLKDLGEQVIDLEGLASHKGSAFGMIHMKPQPTSEQFANDLYRQISYLDRDRVIWIEDESITIGRIQVPYGFFQRMKEAPTIFVDMHQDLRTQILVSDYQYDCDDQLTEAIQRIAKKLGGKNSSSAIEMVEHKQYNNAAKICLKYYDKIYEKSLDKKTAPVHRLKLRQIDPTINAHIILQFFNNLP